MITDANNGLMTKIWGPSGWIFCHAVTFGYPIHPTAKQKLDYFHFFKQLGKVLPCKYCRDSYNQYIEEEPTLLTMEVLTNRHTLTRWFYQLHERINQKLDVQYCTTYREMCLRYESFRAKCGTVLQKGCFTPLDDRAFSYKKLYYTDVPFMPAKYVIPLLQIACFRGLSRYLSFIELAFQLEFSVDRLKTQACWFNRTIWCQNQIKYMKANGIPSIETKGQWKGYPTLDELKLLLFLSSNLNKSDLIKITNVIAPEFNT